MATGGLPLGRWERGADHDILAGADFLSILIESSLRRAYSETTTTSTALLDLEDDRFQDTSISYVRTPRETSPFAQTSTEFYDTTVVSDSDTSSSVKNGVVVAVRVSSSVGRTVNKDISNQNRELVKYTSTLSETLTEPPTTELFDQNIVASEDHPSIVAKASKSELSVEESEPITRDHLDFSQGYPARVRQLPNPTFSAGPSFSNQEGNQKPIHSTLIFHDNPQDSGRSRSVSYSTVIQHPHLDTEMEQNPQQHERHERNYNGAQSIFVNNYDVNTDEKRKLNNTKLVVVPISDQNEMITSTPFSSTAKNWEKNEDSYREPATTERNWEMQEKPYSPPPVTSRQMSKVYGQPEQNYEVDEAVSVVTNGRAHGVQPSLPPDKAEQRNNSSKKDDNQKVGYVVEGRNYRKYRVEERTADGFIVGEYGVVSHDDGSLRGVRYTADGTINPRLIYDALMKFLSL